MSSAQFSTIVRVWERVAVGTERGADLCDSTVSVDDGGPTGESVGLAVVAGTAVYIDDD